MTGVVVRVPAGAVRIARAARTAALVGLIGAGIAGAGEFVKVIHDGTRYLADRKCIDTRQIEKPPYAKGPAFNHADVRHDIRDASMPLYYISLPIIEYTMHEHDQKYHR